MIRSRLFQASICVMIMLLHSSGVHAQKVETVTGTFSCFIDENSNLSFSEAKVKAIENARIEALKQAFGTLVSSDIVSETVIGPDGNAHSELREISQETARGEWLGDTAEPTLDIRYDSSIHSFIYDVTVSGKIRKITRSKVELDWKILCEGNSDKNESDDFANGNHIYVSLTSPVSGYVAIYLMGDDGTVNCLLPYRYDTAGNAYEIKGGKRYVFFDRESDSSAQRYVLKTDRPVENNVVYLIFSQKPFTKCAENFGDDNRPNFLSVKSFEKWKSANMQHDDGMTAEKKWVRITNNL